jgi:hypothetical protein
MTPVEDLNRPREETGGLMVVFLVVFLVALVTLTILVVVEFVSF